MHIQIRRDWDGAFVEWRPRGPHNGDYNTIENMCRQNIGEVGSQLRYQTRREFAIAAVLWY